MIENYLLKRFVWDFNWSLNILHSSISNVWSIVESATNFETFWIDNFDLVDCIIYRFLTFSFFNFHSLDISNQHSLSIFEWIFYSIKQRYNSFLGNSNFLHKNLNRLLTIFIKYFKLFTQIINNSASKSYAVSADKFNFLLTTNRRYF